jgi:SAM-dependent methyltransferase
MTAYNEGKLGEQSILDSFSSLSNKNKISLMTHLVHQTSAIPMTMNNSMNKNFKMKFFQSLFEFIVDNINKVYLSIVLTNDERNCLDKFLLETLLEKLTKLFKGQNLLNKLNHHINKIIKTENIVITYLYVAASMGTLVTFLFWLNKTKTKTLESLDAYTMEQIYIKSIGNSDDRLYKYVLNHIEKHDKLFFQKNHDVINHLIGALSNSMVPPKYQLKRIKILSQQISLVPYFKQMIESFSSEKVLIELHKYYYIEPHSYKSLTHLIRKVLEYGDNVLEFNWVKFTNLLELLKTKEEKISAQIILSLNTYNNFDFKITDIETFEKVVIDNYTTIIRQIYWTNMINTLDGINLNKQVLEVLINNNLITKYLICKKMSLSDPKMLFFTRFLPVNNHPSKLGLTKTIININLLLHKLRLIAKKKSKSKTIQRKVKLFDLLNEIKNFAPNNTIPVLARGSKAYQQQKQKFTNLPPRHLLPGELAIYKNFLLKEKADGILINNLPVGTYPQTSIISNYQVKAEYIEELDLYLVFDIDVPNTTIIDRYNMLRQAHPYTSSTHLKDIDNLDEMFKIMDLERNQIKRFMSENQQNPSKWYPKFSCMYNHHKDKSIYKQLVEQVILEQDDVISSKLKSSEPFNCDGLILTPLGGEREIKIKPKSQMTIDLMFDGKRWVDRNNNDWTYLIVKPKMPKKEGRIYRCYPQTELVLRFTVGEYRYDKKHPNPFNVVDSVINMLNHEWSNDLNDMENYYYEENKSLTSIKLIHTIQAQNDLLEQRIEMLNPSFNKNWLDLGCGRGKLVPMIKKFNPKSYLGLDADIKQLVRALKFHDENQNIYKFNPCDLSTNWESTKSKWFSFNNKVKFDYVIANFSLMHFCTEEFWSQLNEIVHEETKFLFNLVKPTNTNEWNESDSFLKIKDSLVTYKFEWTHREVKTEQLISQQMITTYLNKFGWKVVDSKPVNSPYSLLNFYGWWIVEKV